MLQLTDLWRDMDDPNNIFFLFRVSSVDKDAENFDEFNLDRYLRTQRILKEKDEALINLMETPVFKN